MSFNAHTLACVAASFLLLSGCGGSGNYVWVTGKILKGGSTYVPPSDQKLAITFVAIETEDENGKKSQSPEPYQAELEPAEGTFRVTGPEGSGIPPGKYRISVVQLMKREALANRKDVNRETDMLKNQYGATTSPIVREIKESKNLVIDLDKPTEGAPAT